MVDYMNQPIRCLDIPNLNLRKPIDEGLGVPLLVFVRYADALMLPAERSRDAQVRRVRRVVLECLNAVLGREGVVLQHGADKEADDALAPLLIRVVELFGVGLFIHKLVQRGENARQVRDRPVEVGQGIRVMVIQIIVALEGHVEDVPVATLVLFVVVAMMERTVWDGKEGHTEARIRKRWNGEGKQRTGRSCCSAHS